jgi:hypothetical protein
MTAFEKECIDRLNIEVPTDFKALLGMCDGIEVEDVEIFGTRTAPCEKSGGVTQSRPSGLVGENVGLRQYKAFDRFLVLGRTEGSHLGYDPTDGTYVGLSNLGDVDERFPTLARLLCFAFGRALA